MPLKIDFIYAARIVQGKFPQVARALIYLSTLDDAAQRRHFFLENPIANDDIFFFYTDVAITVVEVAFVLVGSTNVTVFIEYGSDRSVLGTNLITAGTVVSNTTTGQIITSFDNPVIPANSFVTVQVSAISGTPDQLNITLKS